MFYLILKTEAIVCVSRCFVLYMLNDVTKCAESSFGIALDMGHLQIAAGTVYHLNTKQYDS